MKKMLLVLMAGLFTLSACLPSQPAATAGPGVETIVAATLQSLTSVAPTVTPAPSSPNGNAVSFQNVSLVIPTGVATTALTGTVPALAPTTDGPGWDVAPEYIKIKLDNYAQYNTSHEALILVFPAQEYIAVNESAARNIGKLQAILNGSAAATAENLPSIPLFNAAQVFAAQIQTVQFQNGSGVRFLTEYAQYFATANNHDLFYEFQGLTSDGKYYIIAILPTSHPQLAMDPDPALTIPSGGIPFPGYDSQTGIDAYYPAVVSLLNSAAPDSFSPAVPMLDALIQSISITSP